jgi:ATP-dependent DNA ligase
MDGEIKTTNFNKKMSGCLKWVDEQGYEFDYMPKPLTQYQTIVSLMEKRLEDNDHLIIHEQIRLPFASDKAEAKVNKMLEAVTREGGEGLIVRSDCGQWMPERSHMLQKVKKLDDMEGVVTGYITGRETDKGSKLLGLMGALILEIDGGKRLELSGFTDAERILIDRRRPEDLFGSASPAGDWAQDNPGEECPDWIEAKEFPRGCRVTFKYRGKSKDGIPQEARYWRHYD